MSNSYNSIQLVGNLTQDADLKVTAGGKAFLKFSVACNESWKDASGEKQEKTNFFNCSLWGPRAESLAQYVKKGEKIFVSGSMQNNKVEKDGLVKYFSEVNVREVVLCGGGKGKSSRSDADESTPFDDAPAAGGDPWSGAGI